MFTGRNRAERRADELSAEARRPRGLVNPSREQRARLWSVEQKMNAAWRAANEMRQAQS